MRGKNYGICISHVLKVFKISDIETNITRLKLNLACELTFSVKRSSKTIGIYVLAERNLASVYFH